MQNIPVVSGPVLMWAFIDNSTHSRKVEPVYRESKFSKIVSQALWLLVGSVSTFQSVKYAEYIL